MKKIFIFLVAVLAGVVSLWASYTDVDGIWYNFNSTDLTASVTYHGASYSGYANEYSGDVVIPEKVTYEGQVYTVISIGAQAFYDCKGVTSVTLPNTIRNIGNASFRNCSGLTAMGQELR